LKENLKIWNLEVFEDINQSKQQIIRKVSKFDRVDEERDLDQGVRMILEIFLARLRQISIYQEVLLKKKSRSKWLEVGDMNTKYFHREIK